MLAELVVADLGVISQVSIVFGSGMTALTGETGAGKTLLVEAVALLLGGRADAVLVGPGALEARVDGRFVTSLGETVLSRVVPKDGRSRAYIDARPVPVHVLADAGRGLVALHGQHAHQDLLSGPAQRDLLDDFGGVDLGPWEDARTCLAEVEAAMNALGGDVRARAREVDLLRFQLEEIASAGIAGTDEESRLEAEEELLADAVAHRGAGASALDAIGREDGARDGLSAAFAAIRDRSPFDSSRVRLRALLDEVDDLAHELRERTEGIEDDPARLEEVRARRVVLRGLCRKYGEDLGAVLAFAADASARLEELLGHDERAAQLEDEKGRLERAVADSAAKIRAARAVAAPVLAKEIERRLRELAMPRARVEIAVGEAAGRDPGDVEFLLAANPGGDPLPLGKVASGGELARAMLATRLVLLPVRRPDVETLLFDEVDAGIGGEAAVAVGRALSALAADRQVLVVTHLAQVAAAADSQILVAKEEGEGRTITTATALDSDGRIRELSRMLSGQPDSETARSHASELLAARSNAARQV